MDCAQALAIAAAALVMAQTVHPARSVTQRAETFVEAALTRASFEHPRAMMAPQQCSEAPKAIRL
ncbi:hypothetical protein [Terricaulis silvestris]|uniref:Uncharacterized protein n=1 Tax=Terricaulis silvestris TaxID=2686094 RepID=A0A6I6MME4_9CAUL|nr:hypothetical protein [Terricaulis silvestris]QGZ96440.1 hypothetical protein DSM104635_03300 [Terricaulis silvestris]